MIAGIDWFAETDIVQSHEIGDLLLRFIDGIQEQHGSRLSHRFHDEHPGHDRMAREMPLEKGFVVRHVLDAHDMLPRDQVDDAVHEQKRIPVRQNFLDGLHVEQESFFRRARLVLAGDFLLLVYLANFLDQLHMRRMARPARHHVSLDRYAEERQVPDEVEGLVADRFVVEPEPRSPENPVRAQDHFLFQPALVREGFQFLGFQLPVHDHHGIVEVPPLYKALIVQGLDLVEEAERPRRREFLDKLIGQRVHRRILRTQRRVLIIDHVCDAQLIRGKHDHVDALLLLGVDDRFLDFQEILRRALLLESRLLEDLHERHGTPVAHRRLVRVHLHEYVIDFQAVHGREHVFHLADLHLLCPDRRITEMIDHVFDVGRDLDPLLDIRAYEAYARIRLSRLESDRRLVPCMEALSRKRNRLRNRSLILQHPFPFSSSNLLTFSLNSFTSFKSSGSRLKAPCMRNSSRYGLAGYPNM